MKFLHLITALCLFSFQTSAANETWFSKSNSTNHRISQFASKYEILELDIQKSKAFYDSDQTSFTLSIPFATGIENIEFTRKEIHAAKFKVLNAANKDVSETIKFPTHYKGSNSNGKKVLIALSLFSTGNVAIIISNSEGNFNISKLPDSLATSLNQYVLFNDADLNTKNPFTCHLDSKTNQQEQDEKKNPRTPVIQNDTTCRLAEIYWECDHDMFQKGGNSIQGALNQFEAMFNGTAILFEIETINIGIQAVKVWDTPDPYTYQSSFTALDDFQAAGNLANWPGQLAHLISTRNLNLGGVAYLNALCTSYRYGFSNIDFLFSPLPVYSWTLSTIAHELGHNFSSPHTHNCNWVFPGGEIHQIDSCWNAEGGCQPVRKPKVGTIMSYCHLNGSVNLSHGFGPLPGDRIRQAFANMPCVSGTIVIPNYTPINSGPICSGDTLILSAENLTGFSYQWTGPNGFSSTNRVAVIPNVADSISGEYVLTVKKFSCESREKKTKVVFNCMQVGQTPLSICAGSVVYVPFKSTGVFNQGNKFYLQLSNSSGLFTNPINLDTVIASAPTTVITQLPTNITLGNGYKYRFLSTDPPYTGLGNDKGFIINPIVPTPTPIDGSRCGTGSVSLSVNGGSNLMWYSGITELLPIGFGRRFDTPILTQTTSFYAQGGSTSKFYAGQGIASGAIFDSTSNGLIFDVFNGLRLDSISVKVKTTNGVANGNFQLQLLKSNFPIYSKMVSYSVSGTESEIIKIPLYWRLDPAENYEIKCFGSNFKLQKSMAMYPVIVPGIVSIKSQIANPSSNEYPYLFNWVAQRFTTCPGKRVEVKAKITNGTTPGIPAISFVNSDSLICNATGINYEWLINGQVYTGLGNKIEAILNFNYKVRYKIDSCWSDWSDEVLFNLTNVFQTQFETVEIFPNPGNGLYNWKGLKENSELILFDGAGRLIWRKVATEEGNFDISVLSNGIYCLRWQTPNKSGLLKLIKQ